MAIPVPSVERTIQPKLWRAMNVGPKETSFAEPYLHVDAQRKQYNQDAMTNPSDGGGLMKRFYDRAEIRQQSLRHLNEPTRTHRSPMKRPHETIHQVSELQTQMYLQQVSPNARDLPALRGGLTTSLTPNGLSTSTFTDNNRNGSVVQFAPSGSTRHPNSSITTDPARRAELASVLSSKLFPHPEGMTHRPAVSAAQDILPASSGLNQQWPPAPEHVNGRKIFRLNPEMERKRSIKQDMSLWVTGVKKFPKYLGLEPLSKTPQPGGDSPTPVDRPAGGGNGDASLVPGFRGFARFEPPERGKGKAAVQPEKFDPLHFKERFGREHYGPV